MANGFAQFASITDYIQHVVPNLKSQSQASGEAGCGINLLLPCSASNGAQNAGGVNQSTGFAALDVQYLLLRALPFLTEYIQNLAAHHSQ